MSEGVTRVKVASVSPAGEFVILYEKDRQFVVAVVDGKTYKATRQQAFDIPALE
ncbi:MAG: hypothetical protein MUF51_10425 [Vicinamibacteria bacterium]|nr:hypothetical protein [Vicinamibacteria bacterium]